MKTKLIVIPVIIVIVSIFGVLTYSTVDPKDTATDPKDTATDPEDTITEKTGFVNGVVYYVGTPCVDNKKGPPCDGPYQDYEVVILESDGKTIVKKFTTDDEGNFEGDLPSGDYLVFGKIKGFGKLEDVPIQFSIESKKITKLEILIDEGIR